MTHSSPSPADDEAGRIIHDEILVPKDQIRTVTLANPWLESRMVQVRIAALTAAASSTPDMDPETTLGIAQQFEDWILREPLR